MKNVVILLIVIGLVVLGFFVYKSIYKNEPVPSDGTGTATSTGLSLETVLTSQNDSGQNGKAVLSNKDGKFNVVINLSGVPEGMLEPVHIHPGSCGQLDAPRYTLNEISGSMSETTLEGVSLEQIISELPLSMAVHKSADDLSVVACGAIGEEKGSVQTDVVSTTTQSSATTSATSSVPAGTSTRNQ